MELLNYLSLFPNYNYIGWIILFVLSFVITVLAVSLPFIIIYLFSDKSERPTKTLVDSSSGGAEVCAIVCVTCI